MSNYDINNINPYDNHITIWEKMFPKIDDEGIWVPSVDYVPEGTTSNYKLLIPKEMFVEAYIRWIKEADDE